MDYHCVKLDICRNEFLLFVKVDLQHRLFVLANLSNVQVHALPGVERPN